jgi:hypothetical protein
MFVNNLLHSKVFRTGVYLLLVTALVWIGWSVMSAHEQAQSPGEKNLGVAALAMMFFPVIAALGPAGSGCIVVSIVIVVHRRLRNTTPQSTSKLEIKP